MNLLITEAVTLDTIIGTNIKKTLHLKIDNIRLTKHHFIKL